MSDEQEYATGGWVGPSGDGPRVHLKRCCHPFSKRVPDDSVRVKLSDAVFVQNVGPELSAKIAELVAKLIV